MASKLTTLTFLKISGDWKAEVRVPAMVRFWRDFSSWLADGHLLTVSSLSSWLGVCFEMEYGTSVDATQVILGMVSRLEPKGKKSSFFAGRRDATRRMLQR